MNYFNKLNPNWVTGFVDREGCFTLPFNQSNKYKAEWFIQPVFSIILHIKDKNLLLELQQFFKYKGHISTSYKENKVKYQVHDLKDIVNIIIPHFENHPLITKKHFVFVLWKEAITLISKQEHIDQEKLIKILNIKTSTKKGISKVLKEYLPDSIDPNWFTGFFSREGRFFVDIYKSNTKLGYSIRLYIIIGQHFKDQLIITKFLDIFQLGYICKLNIKEFTPIKITNFEIIYNKIIPFFKEYQIKGIKALDFQDFCEVAELINKKSHLTLKGLEKIRSIKSKMNRNRSIY